MASPTSRTLALLREQGYIAEVTEHWNPHTKQRKDLYGFGDIIAFAPHSPVILVQATSLSNMAARKKKILAIPAAAKWVSTDRRLLVIGWKKYTEPVDRKYWRATILELTEKDFDVTEQSHG